MGPVVDRPRTPPCLQTVYTPVRWVRLGGSGSEDSVWLTRWEGTLLSETCSDGHLPTQLVLEYCNLLKQLNQAGLL